ncbi:MAG: hypothetical protein JWL72_1715 [Ilumatobacteraceae bacterium]|nr:hypothetical protein [Ilumatobacteraceae bacterium]
MIDEVFDARLEARVRVALDVMIPQLVAAPVQAADLDVVADGIGVRLATDRSPRGGRGVILAMLAAAAVVTGLFVIVRRAADEPVPTMSAPAPADAWLAAVRPAVPERFSSMALTLATEQQLWIVAVDPSTGKSLEIRLADGGYATGTPTTVDAVGAWVETPQGWSVQTPAGMQVVVACDVGARGREFPGPPNYCDMPSTGPFTKAEVRDVASALATTATPEVFAGAVVPSSPNAVDSVAIARAAAAAVPGQPQSGDLQWGQRGADEIFDFGTDLAQPDTSIRIVRGLTPAPIPSDPPSLALYDDAAAFWMFAPGGIGVRVSTTDPHPDSLIRLEALARQVIELETGGSAASISVPDGVTTTGAPVVPASTSP